jgi:hypothetical protein
MFVELLDEARNLTLDEVADRVHYLINGWFYNHIMVTDLDYVPLLQAWLAEGGQHASPARERRAG